MLQIKNFAGVDWVQSRVRVVAADSVQDWIRMGGRRGVGNHLLEDGRMALGAEERIAAADSVQQDWVRGGGGGWRG